MMSNQCKIPCKVDLPSIKLKNFLEKAGNSGKELSRNSPPPPLTSIQNMDRKNNKVVKKSESWDKMKVY